MNISIEELGQLKQFFTATSLDPLPVPPVPPSPPAPLGPCGCICPCDLCQFITLSARPSADAVPVLIAATNSWAWSSWPP